jgi:hypothetical protein
MQMKCVKLYLRQEAGNIAIDNCSLTLTAFSLSKETKIVIPLLVRRKITFWGRNKIEVIFEKYLESKS